LYQLISEKLHDLVAQVEIAAHHHLKIADPNAVKLYIFFERLRKILSFQLSNKAAFSKHCIGVQHRLDDFTAVGRVGGNFYNAFAEEIQAIRGIAWFENDGIPTFGHWFHNAGELFFFSS